MLIHSLNSLKQRDHYSGDVTQTQKHLPCRHLQPRSTLPEGRPSKYNTETPRRGYQRESSSHTHTQSPGASLPPLLTRRGLLAVQGCSGDHRAWGSSDVRKITAGRLGSKAQAPLRCFKTNLIFATTVAGCQNVSL